MIPLPIDLNDLYVFSQVVEKHGFTAAADALQIPKSRISRKVAQLESRLGVRLLQRNSRVLSLTDAGRDLYRHCAAMLEEARAGEAAARQHQYEPAGTVRMAIPVGMGDIILPRILPDFMRRHPKVRLEVEASNQLVDLLAAGLDLAVRGAGPQMEASELAHAELAAVSWGMVASPAYAKALRQGDVPHDGPGWTLHHEGRVQLQSNSPNLLRQAALAGAGVAELPLYSCREDIEAGRLVLLRRRQPARDRLVALFPSRRGVTPSTRALIDFLKAQLPPLVDLEDLQAAVRGKKGRQ